MGLAKRVIARVDFKNESLVKSMQFDGQRVLGYAHDFAEIYSDNHADEIFLVDTVASLFQREIQLHNIKKVAERINIPLVYAGGIRSLEDIYAVLRNGADKVAINTYATKKPQFLKEAVRVFGSQCIASSMEVFCRPGDKFEIWTDFGRELTTLNLFDWIKTVIDSGVGELMISTINNDGMGSGFNVELAKKIVNISPVPVVISSGAGNAQHFVDVFKSANVSGACAASMFHYNYLEKTTKTTLNFDGDKLRAGKSIEAGNIDFLNDGYGGFREFLVEPSNIKSLKNTLIQNNIKINMTGI